MPTLPGSTHKHVTQCHEVEVVGLVTIIKPIRKSSPVLLARELLDNNCNFLIIDCGGAVILPHDFESICVHAKDKRATIRFCGISEQSEDGIDALRLSDSELICPDLDSALVSFKVLTISASRSPTQTH